MRECTITKTGCSLSAKRSECPSAADPNERSEWGYLSDYRSDIKVLASKMNICVLSIEKREMAPLNNWRTLHNGSILIWEIDGKTNKLVVLYLSLKLNEPICYPTNHYQLEFGIHNGFEPRALINWEGHFLARYFKLIDGKLSKKVHLTLWYGYLKGALSRVQSKFKDGAFSFASSFNWPLCPNWRLRYVTQNFESLPYYL